MLFQLVKEQSTPRIEVVFDVLEVVLLVLLALVLLVIFRSI